MFIGLKLIGYINWYWQWILSPICLGVCLGVVALVCYGIFCVIKNMVQENKNEKK